MLTTEATVYRAHSAGISFCRPGHNEVAPEGLTAVKYRWQYVPRDLSGIRVVYVSDPDKVPALIEYWNRCGFGDWKYEAVSATSEATASEGLSMEDLYEGMRVVATKEFRYICVTPHNRREVVSESGVRWSADVVEPGTLGTVFRVQVQKGSPTHGKPHLELWCLHWDGVPRTANDGYLILRLDGIAKAPEQQPDEVVKLRDEWTAAVQTRQDIERELSNIRMGNRPISHADWCRLAEATAKATAARRVYDLAAGLPEVAQREGL